LILISLQHDRTINLETTAAETIHYVYLWPCAWSVAHMTALHLLVRT